MSYTHKLVGVVQEWNKYPIEDEWLFENFREQVIGSMMPEEAFDVIDQTLEVLVQQTDESTVEELLDILIKLTRQSNRTEAPQQFRSMKDRLILKYQTMGSYVQNELGELLMFYRI